MKKKKSIYFHLRGGFYEYKSEYPTLKETMKGYGIKRNDIIDWYKK